MIWLTWRQLRAQTVIALGALAIIAIILAVTGPHLVDLYNTTVAPCTDQTDCATAMRVFEENDLAIRTGLDILTIIAPALVGVFLGAPLIAREFETGTFRLIWTQSVTRRRWLMVKLALAGFVGIAAVGLISLMVGWWSSPFDRVNADRFSPLTFSQRGIAPLGYAAFAFALGVTIGLLMPRLLPAIAITLVVFFGVRYVETNWVRPHFETPLESTVDIGSTTGVGFSRTLSGAVSLDVEPQDIPNAWILSSQLVDKSGAAASRSSVEQFLAANCPAVLTTPGPPSGGGTPAPANPSTVHDCVERIAATYRLSVTYQPAGRYWAFQGYETGLFFALSLLLSGSCFWLIHRRA